MSAVLAVAAPLAGAVVTVLARGRGTPLVAIAASLVGLGAATTLAVEVAADEPVRVALLHGFGLEIDLYADGAGALLLLTSSVVNSVAALYAWGSYLPDPARVEWAARRGPFRGTAGLDPEPSRFWARWLGLVAAMNGVFLLAHTFALYVAFEAVGVAAVALVVLAGTRAALDAGLRYLVVAFAGSLVYLAGAVVLWAESGVLDPYRMTDDVAGTPLAVVALAVMTVGLLLTAALFPLHFWLPDAHTIAPSPASPILSALVLKVYFYAVLVLWFQALPHLVTPTAATLLAVLGAGSILWGGAVALWQTSLKRLVAYSTLSQMGYLWLVPAMLVHDAATPAPETAAWYGWYGGVYYAIAHSAAKAAMLMAVGALVRAAGSDRVDALRGAAAGAPWSVAAFALAGVSLVGLPPSGGFVGKWYLLTAALASGQWWIAVIVLLGGGLTAAYLVRVLVLAFERREPSFAPLPHVLAVAPLLLALLTVGLGFRAVEVLSLLEVGAPPFLGTGPGAVR
ncbi:oxidoreductase [Egibacter rhizosphaerae]|uniref:Oxidoreductase n=1 Tax=Egibacter rhizosphaerae TaxID=1670831 RepID=A0A411YJM3_9ACTN|nr:proton-conducting transporter membrane subunit [Egibacter rhizosphaerae]QBI21411.1 oxidoreductase [Egibacter rhizosphaerae]